VAGRSWYSRLEETSDLPIRMALGGSMLYHGLAKLRGKGPEETAGFFEAVGLRPARFFAIATGIAETFAGASAILGIATRPAALAVLAMQAVAVMKVLRPKGYDVARGGFEYNLALMAISLGLLARGPGPVSAHHVARRAAMGKGARRLLRQARPTLAARAVELLH
jgi:putative oxidoreductase